MILPEKLAIMKRDERIIIKLDIWKSYQGNKKTGYSLMLSDSSGYAISLCESKYKKDLMPKMKLWCKLWKKLPMNDIFAILHNMHNKVKKATILANGHSNQTSDR